MIEAIDKMKIDLIPIFEQLRSEKRIKQEDLIEAIKVAIEVAAKKSFNQIKDLRIEFDEKKLTLKVFEKRKVVEKVASPQAEISLSEAREIKPDAQIGDLVEIERTPKDFGRIAAQTAKQVIIQKLREAEQESLYKEFLGRKGEVVTGVVKRVSHGNIIVDLSNIEAILPFKEQSPRDRYYPGQRLKMYVMDVKETPRGPQITLSRSDPELVKKLFRLEVSEIRDDIIEIKAIAREAGQRTKVAVLSTDPNVDAVGSCVGIKGVRVRNIVEELSGEKIDVIRWSDDPREMVINAFSPTQIKDIMIDEKERVILVTVEPDQLSSAIGVKGQNIRLICKLIGWKVDVLREGELVKKEAMKGPGLLQVPGIGPKIASVLQGAGITTTEALVEAPLEELEQLQGVGYKMAEKIKESASKALQEKQVPELHPQEGVVNNSQKEDE